MDVAIKILKMIADSPFNHWETPLALVDGPLYKSTNTNHGRENQIEAEHIRWLLDAKLLAPVGKKYVRITAEGMDFLENVENSGVLTETRKIVAQHGGSLAFTLVQKVATAVAKKQLKRLSDLDL